jgi:hypothetical protein
LSRQETRENFQLKVTGDITVRRQDSYLNDELDATYFAAALKHSDKKLLD